MLDWEPHLGLEARRSVFENRLFSRNYNEAAAKWKRIKMRFFTSTHVFFPIFSSQFSSLNAVFLLVKDHCWKLVVNNVFFTITCLSTTCLISRENAHQIDAVIQNNNAIRTLFDTSSMSSLQFQNGVSRWRSCYRVSSCWGVRMAAAALAMLAAVTTWPSPV